MHRLPDLPPLLSAEDEQRLARRIEAGLLASEALAGASRSSGPVGATLAELRAIEEEGRRAWQRFLLSNLRLVWSLARPASRFPGVDADELLQEGFLALAVALRRYDHTRARFSTYAVPVIRQHLMLVVSSRAGAMGLPARRAAEARRAQALAQRLEQTAGGAADLGEVAEALGTSLGQVRELLAHRAPVSLESAAAAEWLAAPATAEIADGVDAARVAAGIALLPGFEREVVRLRFGFCDGRSHSYREVAAALGVSVSSARRACERALACLRARHAAPAMEAAS